MKVVIYSENTLNPINVVDLPSWFYSELYNGREMVLERAEVQQYTIPPKESDPVRFERKYVRLRGHKLLFDDRESLFVTTKDTDDAMLLDSVFLIGQEIYLQDRCEDEGLTGFFQFLMNK